jgi:voltage-gated potassium channel Kch
MVKKTVVRFTRACFRARYLFLLVLIALMLFLSPFLDALLWSTVLSDILLTAIFIAVIYAVSPKKHQLIIAAILGLPLIVSLWSVYWVDVRTLSLLTRIFGALFCAYNIFNILLYIFKSEEVNKETIFAAIDAYLLMALMFAFIFTVLEKLAPGSFSSIEGHGMDILSRFKYFSFVTITTLGYGDIIPLTVKASALATLEAVTGQIYLVVLVAWLVGMHVSRRSK